MRIIAREIGAPRLFTNDALCGRHHEGRISTVSVTVRPLPSQASHLATITLRITTPANHEINETREKEARITTNEERKKKQEEIREK